jgi:hypothetical protein
MVAPILGSTGWECAPGDHTHPTVSQAGAEAIARASRSALVDPGPMVDTLHDHGPIMGVERREQPVVSDAELVLIR